MTPLPERTPGRRTISLGKRSHSLASSFVFAVAIALAASLPPAHAAGDDQDVEKPEAFDDFKAAVAHAKDKDKVVFVAGIKSGHPESFKFSQQITANEIFLAADKVAVFLYLIEDDARLASFKEHFKVTGDGLPIAIIVDSWGKPLASKSGPLEPKDYIAFVRKVAGEDAIKLPSEGVSKGVFGVKEDDLIGSVDLTEMRSWTTVTGQKFTAALQEAKGSKGIFRTDKDRILEVGFNNLSEADIAFLEEVEALKGGLTSFPGSN